MLPSREKSVGLFKVAHGDLLGVMFDSVGDSKIRENRPGDKNFTESDFLKNCRSSQSAKPTANIRLYIRE